MDCYKYITKEANYKTILKECGQKNLEFNKMYNDKLIPDDEIVKLYKNGTLQIEKMNYLPRFLIKHLKDEDLKKNNLYYFLDICGVVECYKQGKELIPKKIELAWSFYRNCVTLDDLIKLRKKHYIDDAYFFNYLNVKFPEVLGEYYDTLKNINLKKYDVQLLNIYFCSAIITSNLDEYYEIAHKYFDVIEYENIFLLSKKDIRKKHRIFWFLSSNYKIHMNIKKDFIKIHSRKGK